jgi:hypothetical protein
VSHTHTHLLLDVFNPVEDKRCAIQTFLEPAKACLTTPTTNRYFPRDEWRDRSVPRRRTVVAGRKGQEPLRAEDHSDTAVVLVPGDGAAAGDKRAQPAAAVAAGDTRAQTAAVSHCGNWRRAQNLLVKDLVPRVAVHWYIE